MTYDPFLFIISWIAFGALAGLIAGLVFQKPITRYATAIVASMTTGVLAGVLQSSHIGVGLYIIAAVIGSVMALVTLGLVRRASSSASVPAAEKNTASATPSRAIKPQRAWARPASKIFISYRRDDSLDVTGRIYDRLIREFGDQAIFRDMDSIPLGIDFRQHIEKLIAECTACVVVIGNRWLTVTGRNGQRRIDDPRDHVRIEIESALKRNVPVVPLLVGGAQMPALEDLPESLQDLAFRNGTQIRPDPDFHRDVDRLVAGLRSA